MPDLIEETKRNNYTGDGVSNSTSSLLLKPLPFKQQRKQFATVLLFRSTRELIWAIQLPDRGETKSSAKLHCTISAIATVRTAESGQEPRTGIEGSAIVVWPNRRRTGAWVLARKPKENTQFLGKHWIENIKSRNLFVDFYYSRCTQRKFWRSNLSWKCS